MKAELQRLRATGSVQEAGLDEAFYASLLDALEHKEVGVSNSFVHRFGRPVLPYLHAVLKEWSQTNVRTPVAEQAFLFALRYAHPERIGELIEITDALSPLAFLSIARETSSLDDEAALAQWTFWEHQADSGDPIRAEAGREALCTLAFRKADAWAKVE